MSRLKVHNLTTSFHTRNGVVRAVDGVSFDVGPNETLGIVGESGSGKSVTCYSLLGLLPQPPAKIEAGSAYFEGRDLLKLSSSELQAVRGKRISMIFQDPMTALNPFMTIGEQLIEPLLLHETDITREIAWNRGEEALKEVGIHDVARRMRSYPHQFSGGMRQRVMIAMALITRPQLLIADEPTTALDVTVQAQILELIKRLQRERGMGVVFISHDLGVIAGQADRVAVMYAGKIVEKGLAKDLFYHPTHPYTRALLASIPARHALSGSRENSLYTIPGFPPDLSQEILGCAFAPRCEYTVEMCKKIRPSLKESSETQLNACLRIQDGSLKL